MDGLSLKAIEAAAKAAEAAEKAEDVKAAGEAFSIEQKDLDNLEEIASKKKKDVSFLGDRQDGWCMKSICQGEFSSQACSGCIGKTSNHTTVR